MLAQLVSADDNPPKAPAPKVHARPPARAHVGNGQIHYNGPRNYSNGPRQFQAQRNFTPNRNVQPRVYTPRVTNQNTQTNVTVQNANRNWRGGYGNGSAQYHNQNWRNNVGQARVNRHFDRIRNWDRSRHDRGWYRSHYSRFARFGGGYYYWNAGFWYPAYGYDPYFSSYAYDAPIYAYNNEDPGQVIANVQVALQQAGYNPGAVDGTYGPMTRNALLNYQRDNGLPDSGEIDDATLDSLGLQ